MIHLDANAGARVHPKAWAAWAAAAQHPSSPHSLHAGGRQSRTQLRDAQRRIGAAIGASADNMVLVSGGTEADALALCCACAPGSKQGAPNLLPHVVTTGVEHAAVRNTLAAWADEGRLRFDVVQAGRDGRVDPDAIAAAITPATTLVSMTSACNETGVIQPVDAVLAVCRARGVRLHTDAVQAVGRLPVDVRTCDVDMLSLSGHKLGAVGGTGALYIKEGTPRGTLFGDAHAGNVPGAASLAAALEEVPDAESRRGVHKQRDAVETWAKQTFGDAVEIIGQKAPRLGNTSCMRWLGCSGEALMMALDVAGLAIATGSACSTGAVEPSPLLLGMGLTAAEAVQCVRLSWGAPLSEAEVEALKAALVRAQNALAGRRF